MAQTRATIEARLEVARAELSTRRQLHVLNWWEVLESDLRLQLLDDIESIPWEILDPLIPTHVLATPQVDPLSDLKPAEVSPLDPGSRHVARYAMARRRGEELLRTGKVAAFTVAGGQGTRLGHHGPKGTVVVTPVGERTLFHLFAETVLAASDRFQRDIPWYIMTSEANHAETSAYFRDNQWFGLPPGNVMLFSQGMLPAFDFDGKLLLEQKHRLARAPDGHGGALKALVINGAIADMRSRGVQIISYFQVDNPLVKPFDPLFIGLHACESAEMSVKVARKADDLEKVGNVCVKDGKTCVVEYSQFPEPLAHARNEDGSRRFDSGNLAIHLLDVKFVDRIVGDGFQLPFRRAEKRVSYIDSRGKRVAPPAPNAVKLETFVFDALPLAEKTVVLEVDRAEEFSPVKNASGVDSLETAQRDQVRRAFRWLTRAGVKIPQSPTGEPNLTVVISPRFALDALDVREKRARIPDLRPGANVWIE